MLPEKRRIFPGNGKAQITTARNVYKTGVIGILRGAALFSNNEVSTVKASKPRRFARLHVFWGQCFRSASRRVAADFASLPRLRYSRLFLLDSPIPQEAATGHSGKRSIKYRNSC
jgi:hypothetical protein